MQLSIVISGTGRPMVCVLSTTHITDLFSLLPLSGALQNLIVRGLLGALR